MKWALGLSLAASVVCLDAAQIIVTIPKNVVSAPSCSASDVQTALNAVTANGTVNIGAGTCHWTSSVSWTAPADVTVRGAGNSAVGGGDATVIVDDYATNTPLITIALPSSGSVRLAGITVLGGTGGIKDNGIIRTTGAGTFRFDHLHMNAQTYTDTSIRWSQKVLSLSGYGVIDHAIFDLSFNSAIYIVNGGGSDGQGNASWAAVSGHGGPNFIFIEDNTINGDLTTSASRIVDCLNSGSRVVVRYNTLGYTSGPESHQTGSSGDNRGCRAKETYGNHFVLLPGQASPAFDMHDGSGGTHYVWGNTADASTLTNGILLHTTRRDNTAYGTQSTPARLGFCGTNFWSATVNTSGTAVTGTSFPNSAGWVGGSGSQAYTVAVDGLINIAGVQYTIASVTDATHLVLTGSAGTQTGATSYIVTNWDGGPTTDSGYPCLDQTGRGQGDLLTGFVPTLTNQTNGNATHTSTNAWPRQALEPVYIWDNTITPSGGSMYANLSPTVIVADRDYYAQASGIQVSSSSPFNGTTGTGWGTRANRPTTCTTGVGYWVIDAAPDWYTLNASPTDGSLSVCTSTNTWSDGMYVPFQYPHPLNR